ncbi:ATP-binding protein [Thermodesulfobacteriota bacterium]
MTLENKRLQQISEKCFDKLTLSDWCVMVLDFWAKELDDEFMRQLYKELILKYARAERKLMEHDALKNRFLGMAAHDLRNPLTAVRGYSELLSAGAKGNMSDEHREFLKIIHQTSDEMLRMVNDLLDVSVIESGSLALQRVWESLPTMLAERIRLCRMLAKRKDIRIFSDLDDIPPLLFDPNRLTQVIDNLLNNAVKFSPPGSRIEVTLLREKTMVIVSVRDEGPGLSERDQGMLFHAFERLGAKPTGGERSTGLGLTIVKNIVDAHGGTLLVQSTLGSGSKFSFSLPLEHKESKFEEPTAQPQTQAGARVMVADDEAHIRRLLREMLLKANYEVVGEAANGDEAISLFGRLQPDILLMDINMPYLTGMEALEAIMAKGTDAVIVMLTSVADTESVEQCLTMGASSYIRKDTPLEEMARIINETYRTRQAGNA